MIAALREGNDLVIGGCGLIINRSWMVIKLFGLFREVYHLMAGRLYEEQPPKFRILSRAAALYVATHGDCEVLVRARSLGSGFPVAIVPIRASPPVPGRGMPARMAVAKAFRL
jgi:hypothetical protein